MRVKILATICVLFFVPQLAWANAGVPMIFLIMPAFAYSLAPIVVIEAIYLSKKLDLAAKTAIKTVTISNLVSTLVGIPLTWFVLVLIQMLTGGGGAFGLDTMLGKILSVTLQAPWLIPYESDLHWMVPAAGFILLIPFFFVSWWSEYLVTEKLLEDLEPMLLNNCVRNANLITYSLLAFWPLSMFVMPAN